MTALGATGETNPSHRTWARGGLAIAATVIALLVSAAVIAVQGRSRAALETSRMAADARAIANELSAVEWRATAGATSGEAARAQAKRLSVALRSTVRAIPGTVAGSDAMRESATAYTAAIADQLTALAANDPERALAIDESRVDPAFAVLHGALDDVGAAAAIKAEETGRFGDLATMVMLVIAALLIAVLYRILDRARRAAFLAYHDPLTGLPNRALLSAELDAALESGAGIPETRTAAVFLDLDDFKTLNDSLGHHAGDELLSIVAKRIRHCARDTDVVARFGGDEFVVMLRDVRSDDVVRQFCVRATEAIGQPVVIAGRTLMPRASIGYALTDDETHDAADLLRNADLAMYAGKHEHKGTTTAFAPEMHRRLIEQLELEDELRDALERDEISVHYQPLVNLTDGRIVSTEALARWNHPRLGLVPPNTFIPMAERTGLIHSIGEWVLNAACRQTAQWHIDHPNDEPLCVSVNVSALQLLDPQLVDRVRAALDTSGLDAKYLTLEITESVVAEGNAAVIAQLDQLDHIGVKLAVDDFGTGYSSLSTLHQFPISILKIDKCFVDHVPDQQERLTLLTSIVDLGRSLGLQTVAEGVEGADQVTALQELGCSQAQGYHFARPLTSETIAHLLDGSHLPLESTRVADRDGAAAPPA